MPPKKPSIDSIFNKNKKSPAGAISIPIPENLTQIKITKEAIQEEITKAASPKTLVDISSTIQKKIKAQYDKFEEIIRSKGCEIKKFLFTDKDDQTQIYYIKVVDLNGTPFYINMKDFPKDIEVSSEFFTGSMILIENAKVDLSAVKYLIVSGKKEDQVLECNGNKFCVVKNTDDGNNKVDIFEIPPIDELSKLAKDIEATQTQKPEGSLNIETDSVISYRVISYEFFNRTETVALQKENLDYYNNQLRNAFDVSKEKMLNIDDKYRKLGVAIESFKNNMNLGLTRTEDLKKVLLKKSESENLRRNNLSDVNEALENYIKFMNRYNKEFVNIEKTYKSIINENNLIVDKYTSIKDKKN